FFLQAVVADHPLNAANANRMASLLKPLGDDFGRCIRIQEAMPNDLALQFTGASIVGLWSSKLALKSQRAVSPKLFQQLKKALFGITVSACCLSRSQSLALAFKEHGQLAGDLIIVGDQDRTSWPDELGRGIRRSEEHTSEL